MTNREWLESLSDEEYDKQVGLHYTKSANGAFSGVMANAGPWLQIPA